MPNDQISPEYAAAIAAHDAAQRKFDAVLQAYRARTVGDDEFLAARREYGAATAVFDVAFAKEAG